MAIYYFAAPLAPGKTEAWKRYTDEMKGQRREEWTRARRKMGIHAEQVWLQSTPNGDIVVVGLEIDDITKLFDRFMKSNDPFDTWFREKVLFETHAMDPSGSFPVNELIFDYQGQSAGPHTYGFVMPIPSGRLETLKRYYKEMKEKRFDELRRRNQKIGLHAVQVWLQQTPGGDFAVIRWDTDDPQKIYDYMNKSEEPFDAWFRDKILGESLNRDPSSPSPTINEKVLDYHEQPVGEKAYTGTRNR